MKTRRDLIAAALVFLVFFVLFFSPAEFGKLMASGDALFQSIPALLGPHNLWEPAIFLGYPLFADSSQQYWYPLAWIVHAIPVAFNAFVVAPFVLAAFGMAGFVRLLTRSIGAGVVAGLIYALGGFMISHAGHVMISHPAAWSPFVLWALESIRRRPSRGAVIAGSVALGFCGIAGQPQVFIFTVTLAVVYAVVSAELSPEVDRRGFIVRALATIVLGIAFAGPELIPAAVLARETTRAGLSFAEFTVLQIPPDQLVLRILFPYVLGGSPMPWFPFGAVHLGEFTEQTIAVGSVASALAILAVRSVGEDRRVIFWYAIAGAALLLAIGDATPIAGIAHDIPVYNLLRIPARHGFEWTFAIAVLGGYGAAAIAQGRARPAHVVGAYAFVAFVAGVAYVMLLTGHPPLVSQVVAIYGPSASRAALSPLANGAIGIPLVTGLIGLGLLWMAARYARRRALVALVAAAVAVDLGCFGWSAYWRWETTGWDALVAPSWVQRLEWRAQNDRTRIDWLPGQFSAALAPNLNLLWRVPVSGGYTALRPRRLDALLGVTDYGANTAQPGENDAALDLAGVGIALGPAARDEVDAAHPFARDDLARFVGAAGESWRASAAFGLPRPFAATRIAMVSDLGDASAIPDRSVVAELEITDVAGHRQRIPIAAGRDTSEVAYDRADVRPLVRHRRARVFSGTEAARHYLAIFGINSRLPIARVDVRWTYANPVRGGITIEKLSLVDDRHGTAAAFNAFAAFYAEHDRWRAVALDPSVTAFSNRQVMPRAWFALPIPLDATAAVAAIHSGRLPSGSRFDARHDATTEETIGGVSDPDAVDEARVIEDTPRRVTIATTCLRPCFLVERDAFDPQWRVTLDGRAGSIVPADLALRGVAVPAGAHTVVFAYRPASLYLGLGSFGLAAILSMAIICRRRSPPPR